MKLYIRSSRELVANIDKLINNLIDGGFSFDVREAYAAAEYLQKERSASSVSISAEFDGESVNLTIGLEPNKGYYAYTAE